ncbi:MAG: GNAT family N-acetyltransferase, partial [Actinomycetota bacterium]|nr:GNAT family N-acetyltransferase [Actinomycetota bacterium]
MTTSRAPQPPKPLSTADLQACLELAGDREWPWEDVKWEFLLRVGQGYGVVDAAGRLVASAVLSRFGDLAAISMVLVAKEYSGQGLGTRLMRHVIAEAGSATVTLYATAAGQPLYEKLGFRVLSGTETLVGTFTGAASGISRPATADDLPSIIALDAAV